MDPKESFQQLLAPLADRLAAFELSDPAAVAATLSRELPLDHPSIRALRDAAVAGMAAGWLLPKENQGIRFGRAAKDLSGFSVDAVWMQSPGPRHRHPAGEIDLCFALDGDPRFDGNPEGWTVYGADSTHVPTVRGGSMLILYFLPGGQIEFLGS
ncbi:MAG: DUF4863 family protein [Planctomycetota bacterium]